MGKKGYKNVCVGPVGTAIFNVSAHFVAQLHATKPDLVLELFFSPLQKS